MPIAFVSYWLLNLPVGYLFGFTLGMGPSGLFLGFVRSVGRRRDDDPPHTTQHTTLVLQQQLKIKKFRIFAYLYANYTLHGYRKTTYESIQTRNRPRLLLLQLRVRNAKPNLVTDVSNSTRPHGSKSTPKNLPTDIVEVRFKNTRRAFYQNVNNLPLKRGDIVAVGALSPGHDIGIVSLTGDLVARQMRRTGFNPFNGEFKKIYRKAKPYDIEKWQEAIELEHETMIASRQIAADMGLNMKIGDVEYQGDKIKAIFYYIADERVDFRELIKVFAERFHIRIEMKQIGARQEAGRIGGLGACGRELCCASWMSSFSSVTTGAARVQEISLNSPETRRTMLGASSAA